MSDELSIPSPTYRIPRQRRGMDPVTRKLALIAVRRRRVSWWWASAAGRSLATATPRCRWCRPTTGPIRVKPANPGGMQIAGANEDILSGGSKPGDGKLAPAAGSARSPGIADTAPAETGPCGDGCAARAGAGNTAGWPCEARRRKAAGRARQACGRRRCTGTPGSRRRWHAGATRRGAVRASRKGRVAAAVEAHARAPARAPRRRSARPSTTAGRCGGCAPAASATWPRRQHSASVCVPRVRAARSPRSEGPTVPKAAIVGIAGPTLAADEAALFARPSALRRDPVRAQHPVAGAACAL